MQQDIVIGIDSSTSATKAIAWSRDGRALAEARCAIELANPKPGHFEQDPEDWWSSTVKALQGVAAQVDPGRIGAIAIANQRETFSIFRADGTALRPGMVWLDDRARVQQHRFGRAFGVERVHAISGKPHDVIPPLYRMLWMQDHEPELFAQADACAEVHAFLCHRLTGRWATSTASADPTGMLDMTRMEWSREILDAARIPLRLMPELVRPGHLVGHVTAEAAKLTGLREGTPVAAGGGDGQCAGSGVGVLREGSAYINMGTALVCGTYSRDYAYDKAFRTEVAIADEGYICETVLRSGTFLIDWFLREMAGGTRDNRVAVLKQLEAEAADAPVGAEGVMLVPYWQGSMTPHWDSAARGVIAGISGSTRRGHLYRAVLEGIAMDQAIAMDGADQRTGRRADRIVAIGGGAASDLLVQIFADVLGRPVSRSTTTEASSLGAAMAAARCAGWFGSIADACDAMSGAIVQTIQPDPGRVEAYIRLKAIYADLWPALSSVNRRLYAFAHPETDPLP
jgi:sugar (pentulose or hexulose) kinase